MRRTYQTEIASTKQSTVTPITITSEPIEPIAPLRPIAPPKPVMAPKVHVTPQPIARPVQPLFAPQPPPDHQNDNSSKNQIKDRLNGFAGKAQTFAKNRLKYRPSRRIGIISAAISALLIVIVWSVMSGGEPAKPRTTPSVLSASSGQSSLNVDKATDTYVAILSFDKVPNELQLAILETTRSNFPQCVSGNSIIDSTGQPYNQTVYYLPSGYAQTAINCGNSTNFLFVKRDTKWQSIGSTADRYLCALLDIYEVPTPLIQAAVPNGPAQCSDGATIKNL